MFRNIHQASFSLPSAACTRRDNEKMGRELGTLVLKITHNQQMDIHPPIIPNRFDTFHDEPLLYPSWPHWSSLKWELESSNIKSTPPNETHSSFKDPFGPKLGTWSAAFFFSMNKQCLWIWYWFGETVGNVATQTESIFNRRPWLQDVAGAKCEVLLIMVTMVAIILMTTTRYWIRHVSMGTMGIGMIRDDFFMFWWSSPAGSFFQANHLQHLHISGLTWRQQDTPPVILIWFWWGTSTWRPCLFVPKIRLTQCRHDIFTSWHHCGEQIGRWDRRILFSNHLNVQNWQHQTCQLYPGCMVACHLKGLPWATLPEEA